MEIGSNAAKRRRDAFLSQESGAEATKRIEFRGIKYPHDYKIYHNFFELTEVEVGTTIGYVNRPAGKLNLVWDGVKIIELSPKNWEKKLNR